jgi:hypothetical protein
MNPLNKLSDNGHMSVVPKNDVNPDVHFQYLERVSSRDLTIGSIFKLRASNCAYRVFLLTERLVHSLSQDGNERWIKLNRSLKHEPDYVYMLDTIEPDAPTVPASYSLEGDAKVYQSHMHEIHKKLALEKDEPVFKPGFGLFDPNGKEANFMLSLAITVFYFIGDFDLLAILQ